MTIVFLDLDGTIIGSNGAVSDVVKEALVSARDAGIKFHVCTGRTGVGVAQQIAALVNPTGFHIFDSGAVAMNAVTRDVLFAEPLDRGDLEILIEHARNGDALLELYTTGGVFAEKRTDDGDEHSRCLAMPYDVRNFDDLLETETIIRGHWIARADTFARALDVELASSHVATAGSPALPDMRFASVTREGASKGDAVRRIIAQIGADSGSAYAIGDTMGDLSMLEAVGHPFVMANADPPLLDLFERLPAIDQDGVAFFLETFLFTPS